MFAFVLVSVFVYGYVFVFALYQAEHAQQNWCYCYTTSYVCGVAIKECSGSALRPEKLIVEMMA